MSESSPVEPALLEQYRLLVRSAEQISGRRGAANSYMLSVNSLLVTVHTIGSKLQPDADWGAAIPLAGLILCGGWWALIRSYRNVNAAKFQVVHQLEKQLPAQPYTDEWALMSRLHLPLSSVEQWIPGVFAGLYLGLWLLA